MKQALVVVVVCGLLATCCGQGTSLDDLIKNIFNTSQPTEVTSGQPNVFQPTPTTTTVLDGDSGNRNPSTEHSYTSCGVQKECVPRFLCSTGEISTDGTGVIDIRFNSDAVCNYLDICCDIPNKVEKPVIVPEPVDNHVGCGYRNMDGVGFRITGDNENESQFGEFPWMVAVLRKEHAPEGVLNIYECGGALISPTVAITGAHCVQTRTADQLFVRAGEWDTRTMSELFSHQDRDVREIIVHEEYNKGALYNDIALLITDSPFIWQGNIQPVCLPEANTIFDGERCYATGWGKDKFGKDSNYQVILKKIDLPVVPRDQCQANLRNTRLGKYFSLHESFICAGGEKDKDTCKGDGGSPLVCPVPGTRNRFYHAGIVAWGIGCGEENIPGVYGSVAHLRPWLDHKLSLKGIDFSHFTV